MLLTMLKSFPWYRDTYMQGSVREVDEKTAKQFVAAGLGKAAPAGAKATQSGVRTPLPSLKTKVVDQRAKKVITSAPVQKGVVGAMMQPPGEDKLKTEEEQAADLAKQKDVLAKNASGVASPAKK